MSNQRHWNGGELINIVFFSFETLNYGGGCEKKFIEFGNWLSANKHKVRYITGSKELHNLYCTLSGLRKHKLNISDEELNRKINNNEYYVFDLRHLLFTGSKQKIKKILECSDIIISKNEIFQSILLEQVFKIDMRKVVFEFHTPTYYPVTNDWKSRLHNIIYSSNIYARSLQMSRCLVLNQHEENKLLSLNKNIKVTVIPNSIDTELYTLKKYVKIKKFSVYYIGRMTEQKGINILHDSIILLSKDKLFNNMEFFFVGSGDKDYYLKELSKRFSNCNFLGFQKDIVKAYHDADIIVALSRWEGLPYVLLEAQSCGIPVITTDSEGCRDIIIPEKNGWICKMDDVTNISKNIVQAYLLWNNDYEKFKKMGLFARKKVIENYSEKYLNKKLEEFLVSYKQDKKVA